MVRNDQRRAQKCYLNLIRKIEPRDVNVIITDLEISDILGGKVSNKRMLRWWTSPRKCPFSISWTPMPSNINPR